MAKTVLSTLGTEKEKIDVRLSYRIVQLFSEGLYASPNKAVEELVANSFDAGARSVAVILPADFHDQDASIVVLDNGEGMDAAGLKQHWLIGKSLKRDLGKLPLGRQQIGKFGIGKLATYVLASQLTHVSKKDGKFYSTSMSYSEVDKRGDTEVEPKTPLKISLRDLTEEEAKQALEKWTSTSAFKDSGIVLFGKKAESSWTFAILSDLKEKVHEIRRGTLEWVLRTALPLRDDFAIFQDGKKLEPSKAGKGRIKKWTLGKEIKELPKPVPEGVQPHEDRNEPADSERRFALEHPSLGRITGYAEAYRDLLTGKSDEIGRSHGFFVYVLGRLINVRDGHFGISPDELRHGTFGRMRVVVHMDGLDDFLQSDRERIREGPVLNDAQNILRAIFNFLRPLIERQEEEEEAGVKLARKLGASPASLARRPIIEMVRAALDGKFKSRYVALPATKSAREREDLLAALENRAETPEQFVGGIDFEYNATSNDGIAVYDAVTGRLRINGLHPFVGAFYDEFIGKSGLPLEMFAMAEVLLEGQLHQAGLKQEQVDGVMVARDELLRSVAAESGRRTALATANALREARNDEDQLEVEVVAAFNSLGFDASRDGRKGKPDGVAHAHLSADAQGNARRYSVTLEAKSKKKEGGRVATSTVNTATIARHRNDYQSEHALVVAPAFATTQGNGSTIAQEIDNDRHLTAKDGQPKTITLIHVDDLARLVRLAPVKGIGLARLRDLFLSCRLPEECKEWVDAIEKTTPQRPDYKAIIETVAKLQEQYKQQAVDYSALRVFLGAQTPPIKYGTNEELIDLCKAMSKMAPYFSATSTSVELDSSPANVLAAIETATKAHLANTH
jgi:hypothetical protein